MEPERSCLLVAYCPECKEKRGLQLKRAVLEEELERDMDVRVLSATCGHVWSLTAQEKKNLGKFLEETESNGIQRPVALLVAAAFLSSYAFGYDVLHVEPYHAQPEPKLTYEIAVSTATFVTGTVMFDPFDRDRWT